jgi:deoxycytidine triphosphate deaminase
MLTDKEIRQAIEEGLMTIDPIIAPSLQPASNDLRVGAKAFVSGDDAVTDVANKGLVIVDPGEFAVVETLERVHCGPQIAGQLGLSSSYARQGLTLLSGPQIARASTACWSSGSPTSLRPGSRCRTRRRS